MKNVLALLADWANGIFAVLWAASITGSDILWWYFVIGILLSHVPDLDALGELWRRGKIAASAEHAGDHRDGLHYPIVWFVVGLAAALVLGYWGWVFFLVTMLHFINDFYGTGWGIKLLWPMSHKNYKLLGRRVNRAKRILKHNGDWGQLTSEERRLRLIVSWLPDELPAYMRRWGMENWIELTYLRLNWISGVEYALCIVAVFLMLIYLL